MDPYPGALGCGGYGQGGPSSQGIASVQRCWQREGGGEGVEAHEARQETSERLETAQGMWPQLPQCPLHGDPDPHLGWATRKGFPEEVAI